MDVFKYGSRGPQVELIQLALKRSGFYTGEIDGVFGTETQNAVRRFQSSFALKPDGIVGALTWKALEPFLRGYFVSTIRSGDTFYRLAKRYGSTVNAIAAANPTLEPENLRIGSRIVIPYGFDLVPTCMRYTPELTDLIIDGLKVRYPFIAEQSYGNSIMGKPLRALAIGSGGTELLINASHHANEWITTPLVLKFAENLLKAYIEDGTIYGRNARALLERVKLFIAPLVNPDGVALVNGAVPADSPFFEQARRIAANYPLIRFPQGWKANIAGTDLNLNYPARWEEARRIKFALGYTSPAPRDYVGEQPLSAIESRALYDYTLAHDFRLTLSYHTQGMEIYWKSGDIEPEGALEIGMEMAQVSGYELAEVPAESANAGYKDWYILKYELPGYTVEAGKGENPLPIKQFDEIYNDNVGIMITAMERA